MHVKWMAMLGQFHTLSKSMSETTNPNPLE